MDITVTTQQALDDAIAAGHEDIVIDSPRGVWVTVRASDSATVRAFGSAMVHAFGSATVRASDSATVHASDSVTVTALDELAASPIGASYAGALRLGARGIRHAITKALGAES